MFSFSKIEGAAGDVAGLTPTVTAFRGLLGEPDNGSNPPAAAGRREINWDGTPDAQSAPNLLPPGLLQHQRAARCRVRVADSCRRTTSSK